MVTSVPIYRALPLPQGWVREVTPKLLYQHRVYAYTLVFEPVGHRPLSIDVRQLPLKAPQLTGHYGEITAYISSFTAVSSSSFSAESLACRYLGPQMSLVFFQELLDRYHLLQLQDEASSANLHLDDQLEEEELPLDGVAAFQDRYDEVSASYHPLGFPLAPYQSVSMLETPLGTFFLGATAAEQLAHVVPGESVSVVIDTFSLASFKFLR